ncbi:hypothetical protein GCM10022226_06370 [Sphaerisporangium flaviroseum]|uniref:Uncharacterized protein n=1 Tax=Sphaerisporangium flaviroseum TaxID=509199 RepID=A0ABP7HDP1_9ACTN
MESTTISGVVKGRMSTARRVMIIPAVMTAAAVTLSAPGYAEAEPSALRKPAMSADSLTTANVARTIPSRYCGQARGSGGYVRQAAPWKSGQYIHVSSVVHCGRADMWGIRAVETHLSQYRGLGIWRAKARKITRKNGRAAYTVTHNLSWKCSGGSQLYRNTTANRVGKWVYQIHSGQRRISC